MNIRLPEGTERQSIAAGFASVEQYVYSLVQRDRERLAIEEGLDAMREGRTEDFDSFDQAFRVRNRLKQ